MVLSPPALGDVNWFFDGSVTYNFEPAMNLFGLSNNERSIDVERITMTSGLPSEGGGVFEASVRHRPNTGSTTRRSQRVGGPNDYTYVLRSAFA